MKGSFYCPNCEALQETNIIEKEQTYCVKGISITLTAPVRVCCVCGEEIIDTDLDNKTLNRFYNEYRRRKGLLLPDEIKNIRNRYNLSQASFSRFLGFGEKTITRYENGAIQDLCHDNIIRLMKSIDAFIILWKERRNLLTLKEQRKIEEKIKAYNKFNITSVYITTPVYYSESSNDYSNIGELKYA